MRVGAVEWVGVGVTVGSVGVGVGVELLLAMDRSSICRVPVEATSKWISVLTVPEGIGPKVIVAEAQEVVARNVGPEKTAMSLPWESLQNTWGLAKSMLFLYQKVRV
jgi:hypothetical protein